MYSTGIFMTAIMISFEFILFACLWQALLFIESYVVETIAIQNDFGRRSKT